jgi:hypothetical protein
MRPSDLVLLASLAATLAACAIPLDESHAPPGAGGAPAPPVAAGCRPFDGSATPPSGAGRSIPRAGGRSLWIFDDAWAEIDGDPCDGHRALTPGSIVDASALPDGATAVALGGTEDFVFFSASAPDASQPFGVRAEGFGVARRQGDRYVAQGYLWTSDRPSFGATVLVEDGFVHAYGCGVADGTLTTDCYVARAPEAEIDDAASYTYADGGGHWIADLDAVLPVTTAGPGLGVVHDLARGRYVMTYVPVLGTTLVARSGLGPAGPWSGEVTLASCDVPAGAFAGGGAQHPELAGAGTMAIGYAPATFDGAAAAADPVGFWPRVATLPSPALP